MGATPPLGSARAADVGSVIGGKYRLVRKLGEGGMGVVWAARNELIDRDVAIKLMLPEIATNADALRRFFNEAKICGSIRDPGIVDVLDLGTAEDGAPFMVMELLRGQSLDALLESRKLPLPDVLRLLRDVATTLALAHARGVIHRDLKPPNLFLNYGSKGEQQIKILDFGISKVLGQESAYATRTGSVLGSPAYMSPEQAGGGAVDLRTDIYSLGVILYEAVSGHIPFSDAPNTNALLIAIATRAPPSLAEAAPGTPPRVVEVAARAMHRDPAQRYATAEALAQGLDLALRDLSLSAAVRVPALLLAPETPPLAMGGALALESTAPANPLAPSTGAVVAPSLSVTEAPFSTRTSSHTAAPRRGPHPAIIGGGLLALAAVGVGAWFALRPAPTASVGPRAAVTAELAPATSVSAAPVPPSAAATEQASAAAPPPAASSSPSAPSALPPPSPRIPRSPAGPRSGRPSKDDFR